MLQRVVAAIVVVSALIGCGSGPETPAESGSSESASTAPAKLSASATSPTEVDLSWTPAAGAIRQYSVARQTPPSTAYAVIAQVGASQLTYPDQTVAPNTTYSYQVTATDKWGHTTTSAPFPITTPPVGPITCGAGYTLVNGACVDVNECLNSPCNVNATCTNAPGSYSCACNAGFTGDGALCTPVPSDGTCGSTNEAGTIQLTCPAGSVIQQVVFASYGTPTGSCGAFALGSCNASSSASTVSSLCVGQQSCTVSADNSVFGDPCMGTAKTLDVQVACAAATPCTYSLSASAASSPASGGSGTFTVTASSATCSWSAGAAASWIHTSSNGTGTGSVSYTVDVNPITTPRSGTINVAGQAFNVYQGAAAGGGGPDGTPPVISIVSPARDSAVSGVVQISATASDNVGVTLVQFYVDNLGKWVPVSTAQGQGAAPMTYTASCDTTQLTNGPHNFLSRAYDAAGNSTYDMAAVTVSNFDPNSGIMSWAKDVGVSPLTGEAQHTGVTVDSQGNLLVVGKFQGSITYAGTPLTSAGGYDLFVAKFTSSGALSWVHPFGGPYDNLASSIAVDGADNVLITGQSIGSMTMGPNTLSSKDGGNTRENPFVAKFTSDGVHVWSTMFGSGYSAWASALAVDRANDVFVTGTYNYQIDFGAGNVQSAGGGDGYLVKFSGQNGAYSWARSFGGSAYDDGEAVAVDGKGDAVVSGYTTGDMDFAPGTLTNAGGQDGFFAKFAGATGATVWSKPIGGTGNDDASALAIDGSNGIVVLGTFTASLTFGATALSAPLSTGLFFATFDSSGNAQWARSIGGQSSIGGNLIAKSAAIDSAGNIVFTGLATGEVDFGNGQLTAGTGNPYVAKVGPTGGYLWAKRFMPTGSSLGSGLGSGVAVTSDRSVIVVGALAGSASFDGTALSSASPQTKDAFLLKVSP
jgi:hypothetical protein